MSGRSTSASDREAHARETRPRGGRLLLVGALAATAVGALVWPAAWLLAGRAQRVQLISPFDAAAIAVNRYEYEQDPTGRDEDVIAIYGTRFGDPEDVVFVDAARVLRPAERPGLLLLGKTADENPLKLETVYYLARLGSMGAALAATAFLLLHALSKRRSRRRDVGRRPAGPGGAAASAAALPGFQRPGGRP